MQAAEVLLFVFNGAAGALLNVLMWSRGPGDVKSFRSLRAVLMGALAGYAYWWAYSVHGLPDSFLTILAGYAAEDFLEWLAGGAPWKRRAGKPREG